MAESSSTQSVSLSMKATIYGIQKKFPSVKNITCCELESWRSSKEDLIILVNVNKFGERARLGLCRQNIYLNSRISQLLIQKYNLDFFCSH